MCVCVCLWEVGERGFHTASAIRALLFYIYAYALTKTDSKEKVVHAS